MFDIYYWSDLLNISEHFLRGILGFSLSLFVTLITIPKIIRVSWRKHLMDEPGERSSHSIKIPNLGGVAIYFAVSITSSIFAFELFERYKFLYAGLVILFFVGLMDDLLVVAPKTKLYAQVLVALMISLGSDVRIKSFFGLLGIYELPYIISIFFTVVVFIIIINSYNLIDGIDGLAGFVGIVCASTFTFVFWRLLDFSTAILCFSMIGSIIGFLYYNMSKKNKIFMGDTGSMVLGFLFSYLAIKFINLCSEGYVNFKTSPVIAIAILIVPLIDTLSVIIIRLSKKQSPVHPDKNHMHHQFLKLGFSHLKASLTIAIFNIGFIVIAYYLRHLNINIFGVVLLTLSLIFALIPHYLVRQKKSESEA